jgi:hypothetical protein
MSWRAVRSAVSSSTVLGICSLPILFPLAVGGMPGADYSVIPLTNSPVVPAADQGIESARLNRLLELSGGKIPEQDAEELRRRVYILIDALVKERHAEGRIMYSHGDLSRLIRLFHWADVLGVPGPGLVVQHLQTAYAFPTEHPMVTTDVPPTPFRLELEFPYFRLRCDDRPWSLRFPYYFLVNDIGRVIVGGEAEGGMEEMTTGRIEGEDDARSTGVGGGKIQTGAGTLEPGPATMRTEVVVLSTLFASHRKDKRHSQSVVLFAFSPTPEAAAFDAYWLQRLRMDRAQPVKDPVLPQATAYTHFDREERTRKEIHLLHTDSGSYAIAFWGIDGSFQKNRPHYLDFLRNLGY